MNAVLGGGGDPEPVVLLGLLARRRLVTLGTDHTLLGVAAQFAFMNDRILLPA
jgi:hypothetical protein